MLPKSIVKMIAALVLIGPTSWWSQAVQASNVPSETETIIWKSSEASHRKEQRWYPYFQTPSVFSPNGKLVLIGSKGATAVLRDLETGQTLHTWQHGSEVTSVAFSPDGKQVLTGSWDKTAVLRDVVTGQALKTWEHGSQVTSVAFSSDGKLALTGSWDKTAVLRDIATGKSLQTWKHSLQVTSVAFSPNSKRVLTASADKTAVLRDVTTGVSLQTWQFSAAVARIAFSRNSRQVIAAFWDGTVVQRDSAHYEEHSLAETLKTALQEAEDAHRKLPDVLNVRQTKLNSFKPVRTEFESVAQFTARVEQWNTAAQVFNADVAAHYEKLAPLSLTIRAKAFQDAISEAYGRPELRDLRYDPERARFSGALKASAYKEFQKAIFFAVPNDQARAAKELLESSKNGLEVELRVTDRNELIWGQPRFSLLGKVYVAQYTDKDFVPPVTTQVAAAPEFQAIAPPPMVTMVPGPAPVISVDPGLAKLQVEVLQKEREQAEASARRAEEARLRERLAELNRLTKEDFKDDLPALLAKLPALKPNPRVHVVAIGINDYADVPDVPFADRSAQQFAEIAKRLFGAQKQNIVVLTNSQATSGALRGRLRTMLNRLNPQDQLLFYYAGHGVPGKDGTSAYLLAQDGGPGSYEEPDLKLEQLYAEVAKSRVGTAKLFIDACFSGRSGKDTIVFEGIAPIVVAPKQSFPDSQRLAVLTAGRGDQFSNQDKERGHRLFSYHLMRVLLEDRQRIAVSELHSRLRTRVLDDSRRIGPEFEQEPELQGNGKLILN